MKIDKFEMAMNIFRDMGLTDKMFNDELINFIKWAVDNVQDLEGKIFYSKISKKIKNNDIRKSLTQEEINTLCDDYMWVAFSQGE